MPDICESVCKTGAIDFKQTKEKMEVNVGAIILSSGIEPFDPRVKDEYGYGKMQNVVTSMDYERLLSSTGPYEGEVLRASNKKHPKKIAWIQCVGSRRVTPGDNSYCSGVCCTYTQKQVILTKDHDASAECTIFHNDIRSFGKDFETVLPESGKTSRRRVHPKLCIHRKRNPGKQECGCQICDCRTMASKRKNSTWWFYPLD